MSVVQPTENQYFGKICEKHPEYLGLRRKCNGACQKCASEKASKRYRSNVRGSGDKTYAGAVCPVHPESGGIRRKINGKCVKCHNKSAMTKGYVKRKASPQHDIRHRVASRVLAFLNKGGHTKKSKTAVMLGCDWQTLKEHLERRFAGGMCWENRALWHIDHIVPLASASTEEELIRLCHYTNLQPLWARDNIAKGSKLTIPDMAQYVV